MNLTLECPGDSMLNSNQIKFADVQDQDMFIHHDFIFKKVGQDLAWPIEYIGTEEPINDRRHDNIADALNEMATIYFGRNSEAVVTEYSDN